MRPLLHLLVVSIYLLSVADAGCFTTKCADSRTVYTDDGSNIITTGDQINTTYSVYGCSVELKLVKTALEITFGAVQTKPEEIADYPGANKCHKIKEMEHAICYCNQHPLCNMDINDWLKEVEITTKSRFKYETGGFCFPWWGVWATVGAVGIIHLGAIIGCIICCIKYCYRKKCAQGGAAQ